ncbi:GGDEF domain protein [Zymobacter palmae]|uniref:GGDEF domain protein n=1 Tax=Zymobacter palmae TaxID=33074 RepID=A0A348HG32_9GAMM|nr:GGDEF domain protein [Zymobacter palmae]
MLRNLLGNAQCLSRIDLVRMAQHWTVGFENIRIAVALPFAIDTLSDLPQRVAFLDRVEARFRSALLSGFNLQIIGVDACHAVGVTDRHHDLLKRCLIRYAAAQSDLITLNGNLYVLRAQLIFIQLLLERFCRRPLHFACLRFRCARQFLAH